MENLVRGHRRAPPIPLIDDEDPAPPIYRSGAQEEYAYPNYTDIVPELDRNLPRLATYEFNPRNRTIAVQYDDGSAFDVPLPPRVWFTSDGRIKKGDTKLNKRAEMAYVQRLANEYRRSNPFE